MKLTALATLLATLTLSPLLTRASVLDRRNGQMADHRVAPAPKIDDTNLANRVLVIKHGQTKLALTKGEGKPSTRGFVVEMNNVNANVRDYVVEVKYKGADNKDEFASCKITGNLTVPATGAIFDFYEGAKFLQQCGAVNGVTIKCGSGNEHCRA